MNTIIKTVEKMPYYYALNNLRKASRRCKMHSEIKFEVHLVEHCNLNCKGCAHFSCIASEQFLDLAIFTRDFKRMSALFDQRADRIYLLGGEPLLHPQITDFLIVARKYFPNSTISIMSNGILLLKMKNEFWETCYKKNIGILVTKYPIKVDFNKIEAVSHKNSVMFSYFNNADIVKTHNKIVLDLKGKQNQHLSFYSCLRSNECITLKNGKLFTCTSVPHIDHFNNYFNCTLKVTEKDYVDIFQTNEKGEILKFLSRPIPFCRYCNTKNVKMGKMWEVSKRKIEEWT